MDNNFRNSLIASSWISSLASCRARVISGKYSTYRAEFQMLRIQNISVHIVWIRTLGPLAYEGDGAVSS
jgi:hypothetical protein